MAVNPIKALEAKHATLEDRVEKLEAAVKELKLGSNSSHVHAMAAVAARTMPPKPPINHPAGVSPNQLVSSAIAAGAPVSGAVGTAAAEVESDDEDAGESKENEGEGEDDDK